MIIDIHAHVTNEDAKHVSEFVRALDENGIDKSVLLPLEPQIKSEFIAEICEEYPDRLIPFVGVTPSAFDDSTEFTLKALLKEYHFKGLKLHPTLQGFSLTDPHIVRLVRLAGELELPVLTHTGPIFHGRLRYGDLYDVDDVAMEVPEATIIMAHAEIIQYGPFIAKKHKNVYIDTSFTWPRFCNLIKGLGELAIQTAGVEKILFGTDSHPGNIGRMREHLKTIDSLNVSDREKKLILGENARKLLHV